ncbi:MAG: hypothetical protein IRY91_08880 [Gemmatimonadaceae bacterium]|nr:hypothetical protein [Gemmatimonadaceae bacterium]
MSLKGEIGALFRREGLYASRLATWRKQRDHGAPPPSAVPRGRRAKQALAGENQQRRRRLLR